MPAIPNLFSRFGDLARTKLVITTPSDFFSAEVLKHLRSLNIEHVSPAGLVQQEISRRTPLGMKAEMAVRHGQTMPDETLFALMRRWFWTRKPDAGFALSGFPATLLQAKVFDEWLDARDEALDGVLVNGLSNEPIVDHYRTLGLTIEIDSLAA